MVSSQLDGSGTPPQWVQVVTWIDAPTTSAGYSPLQASSWCSHLLIPSPRVRPSILQMTQLSSLCLVSAISFILLLLRVERTTTVKSLSLFKMAVSNTPHSGTRPQGTWTPGGRINNFLKPEFLLFKKQLNPCYVYLSMRDLNLPWERNSRNHSSFA